MNIETIAYKLAQGNEVKAVEYEYVIRSRLQTLITISLALIIAYLFGTLQYAIVAGFTGSFFRGFSGGAHSESLNTCTVLSIVLVNAMAYLAKYLGVIINESVLIYISFVVIVFGLYMITKYVPIQSKNRPIRDSRFKKQLKICSYVVFVLAITVFYILSIFNQTGYQIAILLGLGWQLFSMTSMCFLLYGKIDTITRACK